MDFLLLDRVSDREWKMKQMIRIIPRWKTDKIRGRSLSSFCWFWTGPSSALDEDLPGLSVLSQFLCMLEGPFWSVLV